MPLPATATLSWKNLFARAQQGGAALEVNLRMLERNRRPFLVLSGSVARGAQALNLYPAQTIKARVFKLILRMAWLLGVPAGLKPLQLRVHSHCPFSAYLQSEVRHAIAGSGGTEQSSWVMLAGNAATAGQRCIFMLFGSSGRPVGIVKAGTGPEAVRLLRREIGFLKNAPASLPGVPRLRSEFETVSSTAFAMDFVPGCSPAGSPASRIEPLLTSWINQGITSALRDLAPWSRLADSFVDPLPAPLQTVAGTRVHPVIFHGDFAPWNIKETEETWTVLDWERGETMGVPGWDWFHYVIQTATLVKRLATPELVRELKVLLALPGFGRYARETGIGGIENDMVTAYLEYVVRVIQPTEGLDRIRAVLGAWYED